MLAASRSTLKKAMFSMLSTHVKPGGVAHSHTCQAVSFSAGCGRHRRLDSGVGRTVTHIQDTLDLSAKISVTRGVDDVDLDSLPVQHGR